MDVTREEFDQQRRPRFGTANPERMRIPFWEWMIRGADLHRRTPKGIGTSRRSRLGGDNDSPGWSSARRWVRVMGFG